MHGQDRSNIMRCSHGQYKDKASRDVVGRFLNVYTKQDGEWRLVARQQTAIQGTSVSEADAVEETKKRSPQI